MKSFAFGAVLVVLLVCAFQQSNGFTLGSLEQHIEQSAEKVIGETGVGLEHAANGIENGVIGAVHGATQDAGAIANGLGQENLNGLQGLANGIESGVVGAVHGALQGAGGVINGLGSALGLEQRP